MIEPGKLLTRTGWRPGEYVEVVHVGKQRFFGRAPDGDEWVWPIDDGYVPYVPRPKIKPLPVVVTGKGKVWVFESDPEASTVASFGSDRVSGSLTGYRITESDVGKVLPVLLDTSGDPFEVAP